MLNLYGYKKCSTCIKAKKEIESFNLEYDFIDFIDTNLAYDKIAELFHKSGADIDDFFNKRGTKFKEMRLKDKLATMDLDEKLKLLSSDGYLIKRPLLETDDKVIIGLKKDAYQSIGG